MPDAEAMRFLDEVFIRQIKLLAPEQIRDCRVQAELTQQELAEALGVPEATVMSWEDGVQMQTRSLDNLLRVFFGMPHLRQVLITQQVDALSFAAMPISRDGR